MDRRDLVKGLGMAALLPMAMQADGQVTEETVYELRVYHLNEGKLPLILDRFRTKERPIFARCGMHEVAFWVPVEGASLTASPLNPAAADHPGLKSIRKAAFG